jgi:hypothetical protein
MFLYPCSYDNLFNIFFKLFTRIYALANIHQSQLTIADLFHL